MSRAIIVGAGIVGLSSALRLRQRGFSVRVIERAALGAQAATTAAAGILGAQLERHPDPNMRWLCVEGRARYGAFVHEIRERSGLPVELDFCGSMQVAFDEATLERLTVEVRAQRADGLDAEMLDARSLARREPSLAPARGAARYGGDGVLEPRQLLAGVAAAAREAGAIIDTGVEVRGLAFEGNEVVGVELASGEKLAAEEVVIAAGSWSGLVEGLARLGWTERLVVPARGQMLELALPERTLTHVVEGPDAYLSPRADGRVLVGSTVEHVGFNPGVTASAAARLLAGALALVPALAEAKLVGHWSGFRAETPDGLPILGRAARGLILATGHHRNGVLLGPISGDMVACLAAGESAELDAFALSRFRRPDDHLS